ncbi:hypothetical protein BU16DRAFT_462177, partial [Lophium mytilinum]
MLIRRYCILCTYASAATRRRWLPFIQSGGSLDRAPQYSAYTYESLPSPRSFRLLRVHTRRSRTLHCTLEMHDLDSPDTPVYDALSYCWGSEKPTRFLVLHVDKNRYCMKFPENAFKVLTDRASILEPRFVWLDYICIDQSPSSTEKGAQIPLMREIYSGARRTILWVGES